MISLDAATVLLQWATGGMLFCWFTTRRRIASLGYGWLLRIVYFCFAAGALAAGLAFGVVPVREAASIGVMISCAAALAVSIRRKGAGVSGARAEHDRRSERVAAMTGIDRTVAPTDDDRIDEPSVPSSRRCSTSSRCSSARSGWSPPRSTPAATRRSRWRARSSAPRSSVRSPTPCCSGTGTSPSPACPVRLLNEMVSALKWLWPAEVFVMLLPTGMIAVLNGTVDDGWGGMLGWMWLMCSITTIILIFVTQAALKERAYSAVMAATGLLYLAILTGFGMDIVPRAILAG